MKLKTLLFIVAFIFVNAYLTSAQCPIALGDETSFGSGSWIGYVYDGRDNYNSADYQGFITEPAVFDEGFCGSNCIFKINGCDVETETFSVRFKMQETFACGTYEVTIGGDDGVRLSLDGGATYVIDDYSTHGYRTQSVIMVLDGTYDLVLEYFEQGGGNRVSFNYTVLSNGTFPGSISGDADFCSSTSVDPPVINSDVAALSCAGNAINYQWQSSTDNVTFTDIPGANNETYDPPAGFDQTTYFRRQADIAGTLLLSNVVTLRFGTRQGDEVTYGNDSWIGYVYDGMNNYNTADYHGFITELETFDEIFCGGNVCRFNTNGCSIESETFSVRFRMVKNFPPGIYDITIGGDDGVRLSLDGGATYALSDYGVHGYRTTTGTFTLNGPTELVFDYFERFGGSRVSFDYTLVTDLPVELTYFNAYAEEKKALLKWQTASELNNSHFEIQRSKDAMNWEVIGKVEGQGTVSETTDYSYEDNTVGTGQYYYRLHQFDFDGTNTYTDVKYVDFKSDDNQAVIYPNPTTGLVSVALKTTEIPSTIEVFNQLGQVVSQKVQILKKTENTIDLDLSTLNAGYYYLQIDTRKYSVIKL